ncbi:hypothetical protein [Polyangium aurulentum]|uniref:hypothetical protein n=1 Tax=Polyangium aurulentum TaxID=2567896 RepID=UPI0010AE673F|nr:hypothetical protein [Polyangium aurulentum]UQA56826.1 hypothetical protein E8A73_036825 [Polyangium aurulentum]
MTRLGRLAAIAALAVVAWGSPALAAGNAEEAQQAFVDGMTLMGKKRYAEACERFARSQQLDPGMGTQYRLAECYEKLGRLASAYEQFIAVAEAARASGKADREAVARKRAAALEAQVAKLTIEIPPAVAALSGLEVRRDGALVDRKLWGTPVPVDPGDHIVTVKAPRKKPWEGKVWAEGTSKLLVSVAALEDSAPLVEEPAPRSLVPAIGLGAVGGVGLIVGVTFVGLRAGKISDANRARNEILLGGGNCVGGGTGELVADCSALSLATSSGDTFGTVSLVGFIAGGAALAGMVTYLLLPAPAPARATEARWHVSPVLGGGQSGFSAWGTF